MMNLPDRVGEGGILAVSPKKDGVIVVETKVKMHLGVRLTGGKVKRRIGPVILFAYRPRCYEEVTTINERRGILEISSNGSSDYYFECELLGSNPAQPRWRIKQRLKVMGFDAATVDEVFAIGHKRPLHIKSIIPIKKKETRGAAGYEKYSVALLSSTDLFLGARFGGGDKCLVLFTRRHSHYSVVDALYFDATRKCKPFEWQRIGVDEWGYRCSRARAERRLRRLGFGSNIPDRMFPRQDREGGIKHGAT